MKTDIEILEEFCAMLRRNGVEVQESYDEGKEFTIISKYPIGGANSGNKTLTLCTHEDGSYWRIMGFVGDYFTDEIHK